MTFNNADTRTSEGQPARQAVAAAASPPCMSDYLMGKQLGTGCFSVVRQATYIPTGVQVAVKIVSKAKSNRKTLDTEIEAMRRCRGHPNIVQLYAVHEDLDYVYLVLEHCEGGNLHDFLVKNGAVSERQAAVWVSQLASALEFSHRNGVINRDVKNANIFLCRGSVKLGDFGLAHISRNAYNEFLWSPTGSPVFAAPEVYGVYEGNPYTGPASEVWSLGCVLHSMLTVRLPFSVDRYHEQWTTYMPPRHISPDCRDLIVSMFHFRPCLRPTTGEVLRHRWIVANLRKPSMSIPLQTTQAADTQTHTVSATAAVAAPCDAPAERRRSSRVAVEAFETHTVVRRMSCSARAQAAGPMGAATSTAVVS